MSSESTGKLFYRYSINSLEDLNKSTIYRRLTKSAQSNRNAILFDISNSINLKNELNQFFDQYLKPEDLILTNPINAKLLISQFNSDKFIIKLQDSDDIYQFSKLVYKIDKIICMPITKSDLKQLTAFYKNRFHNLKFYWEFKPYNPKVLNSLTVRDIFLNKVNYSVFPGLEIYNSNIPSHYELTPQIDKSYRISWSYSSYKPDPQISVVIPTFNNVLFLSNTILHLLKQDLPSDKFEILIVDDGSTDNSEHIIKDLYSKYKSEINLKYIYWPKLHPIRGEQNFFRSGQARNLGVSYSSAEKIIFLDSDMLVPTSFLKNCIENIKPNHVTQYQRFHITQIISQNCPSYRDVDLHRDTYVEEELYWNKLFKTSNWMSLLNYWKYTCTYSLGIMKNDFINLGMFKKYYVSYGFEDTDLGFEAYLKNFKFELINVPLLHQTSYDQMQYGNSKIKRFLLLKKTAELFYLQHLKKEIFDVLGGYFRFQKPVLVFIRDLL